ncbi:PAS domain-containing protein [Telluribacter humicola]|uniref:PAS domain-containing protein n=1 Tax=Telluribacter humicola TaxID=1720261 RepID=UPI001E53519C|nr:PAS domain-containing protein [Telluribacter humicola]
MMKAKNKTAEYNFMDGGGEMGQLTRQHDWSATPLGTPDQWPSSLRTTISIILNSRHPMFLWWGSELIQFYNDAYRPSLGNEGKHPTALGQRGEDCWPEIWLVIKPLIDQVLAGGEATWSEDQLIPIYRNGHMEDVYWTFGYSPVKDESGQVGGVLGICTETTQKIQQFRQLQFSEQRLQNLVQETSVGTVVLIGEEMRVEVVNDSYAQLIGRQVDELLSKPIFDVIPEAEEPFRAIIKSVMFTGEPLYLYDQLFSVHVGTGQKVGFLNLIYQPYRELNGTISGITVLCQDVTEQVLARQRLAESEARFRSIVEEAPVATCLFVGRDMTVLVANEMMLNYWGKGHSVIGKPLKEAVPELEGQPFLGILDDVYTTGQTYEARNARAALEVDGVVGIYYYNFTYKPLFNASGEVYAIMDMAVDVTKEVLAQQQVQEAQELFHGAIELAELGTWQLNLSSGLLEFSDRLRGWFGIRPGETITKERALAPIRETDRSLVNAAVRRVTVPGLPGSQEVEFTVDPGPLGRERVLKAQGRAYFSPDGKPSRAIGTVQDVTEQRKQELALMQQVQERTRELAEANRQLTEANSFLIRSNEHLQTFAYVASHDLQEPLRKIQQFGDLLKTRFTTKTGDELMYLERMQHAAHRMSALIQDLLNFSYVSSQSKGHVAVSLTKVVGSVLVDLEVLIEESEGTVHVDALPTIEGDASQLGQLFQNLLNNALKFRHSHTKPFVSIRASEVPADQLPNRVTPCRQAAMYHRIDVQDNGIGFDEKYLNRIFQLFQRLHGRSEFAGTGIGLAICERVVTNHGGAITASSQMGEGATFTIFLPQ